MDAFNRAIDKLNGRFWISFLFGIIVLLLLIVPSSIHFKDRSVTLIAVTALELVVYLVSLVCYRIAIDLDRDKDKLTVQYFFSNFNFGKILENGNFINVILGFLLLNLDNFLDLKLGWIYFFIWIFIFPLLAMIIISIAENKNRNFFEILSFSFNIIKRNFWEFWSLLLGILFKSIVYLGANIRFWIMSGVLGLTATFVFFFVIASYIPKVTNNLDLNIETSVNKVIVSNLAEIAQAGFISGLIGFIICAIIFLYLLFIISVGFLVYGAFYNQLSDEYSKKLEEKQEEL